MGRGAGISYLTTLILLHIALSGIAFGVVAQSEHEAHLSPMEPASALANVDREHGDRVYFNASVTVDKMPVGLVTVYLYASCSEAWHAGVNPDELYFASAGTKNVTVGTYVPAGALHDVVAQVRLDAVVNWTGRPSIMSTNATVRVNQFYDGDLQVLPLESYDNPASFTVTVWNRGNGEDSFRVGMASRSRYDGFDFRFNKTTTRTLAPGEREVLGLTASYDDPEVTGRLELYITAVSFGSEVHEEERFQTEVRLRIEVEKDEEKRDYSWEILGVTILIVAIMLTVFAEWNWKRKKRRRGRKEKAKVKGEGKGRGKGSK